MVRDLFDLEVDERSAVHAARAVAARARAPRPEPDAVGRGAQHRPAPRLMRIGTRGSALALTQATWVAQRLGDGRRARADHDRRRPRASGLRTSRAGSRSSSRRCSTVASISPCTPPRTCRPSSRRAWRSWRSRQREDPRDAICGAASLEELAAGARVGTSSLRRAAQLRALRPDLEVVPCAATSTRGCASWPRAGGRARAGDGGAAAARARRRAAGGVLEALVPAAGQGALALEAPPATRSAPQLLAAIHDARHGRLRGGRARADPGTRRLLQHRGRRARPRRRRRAASSCKRGWACRTARSGSPIASCRLRRSSVGQQVAAARLLLRRAPTGAA